MVIVIIVELILDPPIDGFDDGVIGWSTASAHGTDYVIILMSLLISSAGVDSPLVCVKDDGVFCSFYFGFELLKGVEIGLDIASLRRQ